VRDTDGGECWPNGVSIAPFKEDKMNWQKIEDTKGFEEFLEFYMDIYFELWFKDSQDKFSRENQAEIVKRQKWQSLWGWILQFFDGKGIIISFVYTRHGYMLEITDKKVKRLYFPENPQKIRQEAQEAAAIKAFEIREKQLKDKT
jgi:hypothetical protein